MKKEKQQAQKERRTQRVEQNFAKEHLKTRLNTLRRKIMSYEKKAQRNKKLRMAPLEKLIAEYNQTLELIYGKAVLVHPHFRLQNRTVEQYIPITEMSRESRNVGRGGLQKASKPESIPEVTTVHVADFDLEEIAGFDSQSVLHRLEEDADLFAAIEDRFENPDEYLAFVVEPLDEVKPGEVMFVVYDLYGNIEFAITLSLVEQINGNKSYVPFVKELAFDLFDKGFECVFFVSNSDFQNGLITPNFFDDDSDANGGPSSFSFS